MNCCDLPAKLPSFPKTWQKELSDILCEIINLPCECTSEAVSYLFNNGISDYSDYVGLGGSLTKNTDINANIYNFSLTGEGIKYTNFPNTRDDSALIIPANFLYTDDTGFLKSASIDYILDAIGVETAFVANDGASINFTTSGTLNHTLTGEVILNPSSPFSISSGLVFNTENGLNIFANKLKLGGALTEETTFTGAYKMFLSGGPKLHIGPDAVTHSLDSLFSVISDHTTLPAPASPRYLVNVRNSNTDFKNYFSIVEDSTNPFRINIGWMGTGVSSGDIAGALTITDSDATSTNNGITSFSRSLLFTRNKPIIFSGFGYPSSPEAPIGFNTIGATVRQRYDSASPLGITIGTNQELGSSFRVHSQPSHITSLNDKYEVVGAKISSNNGAYGTYADTHRNVNLSVEYTTILQDTVNLLVTGWGVFNDNSGNTAPNKYTGVKIGSLFAASTLVDGDPRQNKILTVKDIEVANQFGVAGGYNIIGYHYNPTWLVTAPAQSARDESAILTERGKVLFKNADNVSYVQFPIHTVASRNAMSGTLSVPIWGASQKGAQIFVTDATAVADEHITAANTMQYWNGTTWIVM